MIDMLHLLTTIIIGLYAGSLLTEGVILVPYWQGMKPSEFFRLHGTLGPNLFKYFAPLTSAAVALSVIAAIFGHNHWHGVTAALCCTALVIFFLYFKKANAAFAAHRLKDSQLEAELSRWANWHWLRTVIIIAALATSVLGHN